MIHVNSVCIISAELFLLFIQLHFFQTAYPLYNLSTYRLATTETPLGGNYLHIKVQLTLKPWFPSQKVLLWQLWSLEIFTSAVGLQIVHVLASYWYEQGDIPVVHSLRPQPYGRPPPPPYVALMWAFPLLWTVAVCRYVFPSARPLYRAVILHFSTVTQQLPSFPHAGLRAAQLLIGLVEDFQLVAAPAPPDTQAPLHVFLTKATYNCVFCH